MRDINFGKGKWVFIDWLGIEPGYGTSWGGEECTGGYCVPHGIEIRAHNPDVLPGLCIPLDEPWEKGTTGYATFMEDAGVFRCWYEHLNGIGYAESNDGINWRKPVLNMCELNGSNDNNLLGFGYHGAGIFIDPSAPSAERYKMVGCLWSDEERATIGAVSPDGLNWTPLPEPVLRHNHADTQNIAIYDEDLGSYVLYTRQAHGVMQRRGINRAVADDFRHFSPSVPVFECNPLDPPDWDYYCNGYSKWPGAYAAHVMRISMYKHTPDVVEVHLATSRDGIIWHRPQGRQAWISGGLSYPDPYTSVYACSGILQTAKGEWSTYAGAAHHTHNESVDHMTQPAGIIRARMREDGFMSMSSEGPGEFWTIPFVLDSNNIRLNVKTRNSGFIRAEILASSGGDTGAETTANNAVTGHSLPDCIPISGDHIDAELTWKTGANLDALRGQTVRLHVEMYNADLYAIKF
jgi:hypothetical protein